MGWQMTHNNDQSFPLAMARRSDLVVMKRLGAGAFGAVNLVEPGGPSWEKIQSNLAIYLWRPTLYTYI